MSASVGRLLRAAWDETVDTWRLFFLPLRPAFWRAVWREPTARRRFVAFMELTPRAVDLIAAEAQQ